MRQSECSGGRHLHRPHPLHLPARVVGLGKLGGVVVGLGAACSFGVCNRLSVGLGAVEGVVLSAPRRWCGCRLPVSQGSSQHQSLNSTAQHSPASQPREQQTATAHTMPPESKQTRDAAACQLLICLYSHTARKLPALLWSHLTSLSAQPRTRRSKERDSHRQEVGLPTVVENDVHVSTAPTPPTSNAA